MAEFVELILSVVLWSLKVIAVFLTITLAAVLISLPFVLIFEELIRG